MRPSALVHCLIAAAAFAGALAPAGASAQTLPGQYIVVYRPSVDAPARQTTRLQHAEGFRPRLRYSTVVKGFAARLTDAQVRALRADPSVAAVTPDRLVHATGSVALAAGDSAPTGVQRMQAATATTAREASTATVAVLDTGIDLAHPDLNASSGTNCVTPGSPAADDNGHGTHVAGTIGARNDGAGVVGVAPGTRLVAVKVLDAAGSGSWSNVICGIDWVTATRTDADPANDVGVANLSLSGTGSPVEPCASTVDALHQAICASTAAGVTYVVAAGNEGRAFDSASAPSVPAAYSEVLTVTAVSDSDGLPGATGGAPSCRSGETDDRYATFSNYATTAAAQAHTIAGPGTCIRSTARGGGYATMSGTSMASPHLAGAVALCLGEAGASGPCSGLAPAQVIARMRADADAHTRATPSFGFTGDPLHAVSGRYYGFLDWAATVAIATTPTPTPTPTPASAGTASPTGVTALSGTFSGGSATALGADDNVFLQTASTTSGVRTTSWQAVLTGIARTPKTLRVALRARTTAACTQVVALWRFTTGVWVTLDSRGIGATEALVDKQPAGRLADYVSSAGEARVRVACTNKSKAFTHGGDLLRVTFIS